MADASGREPLDQVRQASEDAGFGPASKAQLHRWQQAGLLPSPEQHALGRGHGSTVDYPPGTADQLVALRELLAKKRSFDFAGWQLWLRGHPVGERLVRKVLSGQLAYVEALRDAQGSDQLIDVLEKSERARLKDPAVARTRRRVGRSGFPTLLGHLIAVAAGSPQALTDNDANVIARGAGLPDAQGLETTLEGVAGALDPAQFREALDQASFEDLNDTRDEIQRGLALVEALAEIVSVAFGRPVLSALVDAIREPSLNDSAHIFLVWLSLRREEGARKLFDRFQSLAERSAAGLLTPAEALRSMEEGSEST